MNPRPSEPGAVVTINATFARRARAAPDRLAIVDAPNRPDFAHGPPRRLTYAALASRVDQLALALHKAGLRAGDVLLVQMPNIVEIIALYLATARLGVIASPVPVQYRHGELAPIVDMLRPRAFCSVARFGKTRPIDLFRSSVAFDGAILGFGEDLAEGVTDLDDGLDQPCDQDLLDSLPRPAADALFSLCWTSGTEGRPKAVPKTHANWLCSAGNAVRRGWIGEGGTLLMPFPAVNAAAIGGLMMSWLGSGGTLVLHHPFNLDVFLRQIAEERVGYTVVAPSLLASLATRLTSGAGGLDLSSLGAVGTGSAPVDPGVLAAFEAATGIQVINIFGSNEGLQLCSDRLAMPDPARRARFFSLDGDQTRKPGSEAANGARFVILAQDGDHMLDGAGEIGEMAIAGPPVFPGYWRRDGLDRSRFTADGYFRTGDLFEIVVDADGPGAIRFVGRARDLIIRGGMKIAPAELDAVLASHPAVQEAAVAPFPDERLGERVCAFVVPRPGATITLDDVLAHVEREGLARFKWPERLVLIDALPRNALAKVQRSELARLARENPN